MTFTIVLAVITCITLIISIIKFPTIKIGDKSFETFWMIALIGALLMIATVSVPVEHLINNLTSNSAINPIKIIVLLLSLSMLSITLDELGFFEYVATKAIKYVKNSQVKLFLIIFLMVAILTVFTSNDIVILTFTLFICYLARKIKINPIPYLIMEFVTANTCSMFLIIGNPTNIYIATAFEIGFMEYFKIMFLPTLAATLTMLFVLLLIFKKQLSEPIQIDHLEPKPIKYKALTIISIIHLLLCTGLLAVSSYINLEMWLVTIMFAGSLTITLLIFSIINKEKTTITNVYKRLPYSLGIFVLSMFIIILALDYNGITKNFAGIFDNFTGKPLLGTFIYGFASSIFDNLINNIPMSLFFTSIISSANNNNMLYIFSTIIGSNIGAFLTPIGALAGMMWMHILKKQKVDFSFLNFTKYGLELSVPILVTSLLTLWLIL